MFYARIIKIENIFSFLIGVLGGFLLLLSLYLYAVLKSINKKKKIKKTQEQDIDEKEINYLINEASLRYKNQKDIKLEKGSLKFTVDICKDLIYDISSKYYPKSKMPYFELTIDETLLLAKYISERIDSLLDAKILNLVRKMTIKQIIDLKQATSNIANSKIVKSAKKIKADKIYQATRIINPIFWIKKATVDSVVKVVMNKIYQSSIVIVGEETYKIYSKKVFHAHLDDNLDIEIDKIYDDLSKEGVINEKD